MRIVHVIDYFQPRLGYQETWLAQEQIKLGHEVFVITSDRYRKALFEDGGAKLVLGNRRPMVGSREEQGIPVYRLPVLLETARRVWLRGLEEQLIQLQPNAIHVHGMATFTAARVAHAHLRQPALKSVTLLIDDHMYPQVSNSPLRAIYPALRATVMPLIRRSADWIVAVSTDTRDFMTNHYGLESQEIKIIRLGVDQNVFRPDPVSRRMIRSQLGMFETDVVCIYTGKIMPRKQVEILIGAIAKVAPSCPGLKLLVVGYASDAYMAELRVQVASLGLTNRVLWRPAVPQIELARYFTAADIAAWPAEHSISFLEAMACGLPLVVSDAPKSSEEVAYGNGLAFPQGDQTALAARLQMLIDSPELRASMGAASRRAVETHYTWSVINQEFMRCYAQAKRFTEPCIIDADLGE